MSRRLPVYLLLDTSGSMSGEAIQAVQQGVLMLIEALKSDPMALETAWLSIITFDSMVRIVSPLTEINAFNTPILAAGGMTSLGAGIETLLTQIGKEVIKGDANQKADWKPLIFVMTDGKPTDAYEKFAEQLKAKRFTVIACAAGEDADVDALKKITELVIRLKEANAKTLKNFFKWFSQSVSNVVDHPIPQNTNDDVSIVNLPMLPDDDQFDWVK